MMKSLGVIGAVAALGIASAVAGDQNPDLYKIQRVEIEDITQLEEFIGNSFNRVENPGLSWRSRDLGASRTFRESDPPATRSDPSISDILKETDVILDSIISIGTKVWRIVEKNRPVVSTNFQGSSVLPEGAKHWQQLQGWEMPQTRVYRQTYTNGFGMTVVDFAFRISYTYGGSVDGKGKFLSNVEVEPRSLDVAWGYKFSATGQVLNPHNAGTKADPVAAAELRINWQLQTVMKDSQESERFFIRGDGLFKDLSDGTLPAQ